MHNIETRSAVPTVETREDTPPESLDLSAITGAVTELRTAATAFETRLGEQMANMTKRLDAMETRSQRLPTGTQTEDQQRQQQAATERRAFATYLRHGPGAPAEEIRTLTVSSDPSGGYLAPAEMATEFVRDLVQYSPVRTVASVRTTGAPSVKYPRRTGITNATWVGEAEEASSSEPTFGQLEVPIREVTTYTDVSNSLLADSGGAAETEVRLALAEDFGQKEGLAFVSGDGVIAPEGVLTNGDIGYVANGHATTLAADSLINLFYALPATYRNAGAWALNGTTLATIRKLKDGNGQYLWQPSLQVGQPETILGRPVVEMVDMPDVASAAFPIVFGDWSGYRVVDRLALSILVNPYLLASKGVTRIHATRRVGGGVLQAARFKKLKMSVS
jgi:HK97 family phage major capsid protein